MTERMHRWFDRWSISRTLGVVAVVMGVVALTACQDLADPPGTAPLRYRDPVFTSVSKTADVPYRTATKQDGTTVTLKVDIYRPAGDTVTRRPLYILAFGGAFAFGDKTSPEIVDQATEFAKRGYVTAAIQYRTSQRGCTSVTAECVQAIKDAGDDGRAAVRWFRANATTYGIDTNRIAMGGTSAGGITALGVGYEVGMPEGYDDPASKIQAATALSGAAVFTGAIDPGDAPALLFHGTADSIVPYAWAKSTCDEAAADGLACYLWAYDGAGHVPYQHRDQIIRLSVNFLYHRLDLANAAA